MHKKNWKTISAVDIRWYDGRVHRVDSVEAACRRVGWYELSRCKYGRLGYNLFGDRSLIWGDPVEFRDELGLIIPLWRVFETAKNLGLDAYTPWRRLQYPFDFRNGPVPRTGYRRYGRWYRHFKTTQERRENDFLDRFDEDAKEAGVKVRSARNLSNLPTAWDEKVRGREQSWKAHRRRQWKEKA